MKKTLKFIFIIGPCFFLYCMNTNAYSVGLDMEKPMNTILYDHIGTNSFSILESDRILGPDNQFLGYANVSIFNPGQYGFSTSFCGPQFVKDNYYSVSIYYLDQRHKGYLHPRYANYSSLVGIGTTQYNAMSYSNISDLTINTNNTYVKAPDINDNLKDVWLGSVSYVFKANQTSNCMRFSLSSEVNQTKYTLGDYIFLGYRLENQGNKPLSSSDIQNIFTSDFNNLSDSIESTKNDINNNINNSTNDINNNINNATNSINNAIDIMKDSVNDSINSEDNDTSSSKCGILCKLKGIFNGIVNLPSNLWNALKGGFEAISNVITSLFEGIKNIFTPKEECSISPNLFHFDLPVHRVTNLFYPYIKHSVSDNVLKFNTTKRGTFIYTLGKLSDYIGKNINISAKVTSGVSFKLGYFNGSSVVEDARSYSTTTFNMLISDSVNGYTLTLDSEVLVLFDVSSNSEVSEIMVDDSGGLPYEPYGKTCTGGGSFFDWFGNFFKSIVSGIFELPGKIVNLLLDGLKSLFVPTQEQLMDILDESQKLTENFGFVGEAMSFFLNIFTSLLGLVNQNGCINLPEFTIGATSLFESHTFWQAQNVCLSDNAILSSNIETIRTITSIALVTLFINFAVSKFFGILSKNDSGSTTTYNEDGTATTSDWSNVNGNRSIYRRKT